jgi:uncharacterized Rmd1/YagE family protein
MKLYLFSIYLHKKYDKNEVATLLGIKLTKGIETAYYGFYDDIFIALTQFNVLTLIHSSKENIVLLLNRLNIENLNDKTHIYQDHNITIDENLNSEMNISNSGIFLRDKSALNLNIISLVVSQSVGLDKYERELNTLLLQSHELFQSRYSIFKRGRLIEFVKHLALIRHDMLSSMFLLDKPNIVWDNESIENLYNSLANLYEVKDRFDIVEYKLNQIKDDITLVMDFINHRQSEFLEWIIIILIVIEILMGLVEWFKPNWIG